MSENITVSKREEYPRPQFERNNWINLNGKWGFEFDNSRSGEERGLHLKDTLLNSEINVPFCPQSVLSGIEVKDFIYGVWYNKKITVTEDQLSYRAVIHFGAVDYESKLYINGSFVGAHKGGYSSFEFDISDFLASGENTITLFAADDERNSLIPRGKQSEKFYSNACDYTRTTGIWQTVWLEFTPKSYIEYAKYYPDYKNSTVSIELKLNGCENLDIDITYKGKNMAAYSEEKCCGVKIITLPLSETHLWEIGHGRLYDVNFEFGNDSVKSYFGLRNVEINGMKFLLNGKSIFQRLILDQGYYPDGIYTAPSEEALVNDIMLALKCGFNGARPHEKIFEERYFYHCDKLGFIVWGEYPDKGLDAADPKNIYSILPEWIETVNRDFNHPSIIGWAPHNEVWGRNVAPPLLESIKMIYDITKTVDRTRPCIDSSGGLHVCTDIYDIHDYNQNVEVFKKNYDRLMTEGELYDWLSPKQHYSSGPVFMSEFGGAKLLSEGDNAWGYGNCPKDVTEFMERFEGLCNALLDNSKLMGFCYTQLTDIEQEQNGLFTYQRIPKFDCDEIKKILSRKAAIED